MIKGIAIAVVVLCGATAAGAADLYIDSGAGLKDPADSSGWIQKYVSEFRFGGMYHDPGIFGNRKEKGEDINGEILFNSPDFLSSVWAPRPHLGGSVNDIGYTSQVYAGLTWSFTLWRSLFFDFSEGPSLNDDTKLGKEDRNHKDLGSHILFREQVSLGWKFDNHNSLSVMLDHISNAGLADHNGGMETIGLRYGYHF